jgi:hypothetical protein
MSRFIRSRICKYTSVENYTYACVCHRFFLPWKVVLTIHVAKARMAENMHEHMHGKLLQQYAATPIKMRHELKRYDMVVDEGTCHISSSTRNSQHRYTARHPSSNRLVASVGTLIKEGSVAEFAVPAQSQGVCNIMTAQSLTTAPSISSSKLFSPVVPPPILPHSAPLEQDVPSDRYKSLGNL